MPIQLNQFKELLSAVKKFKIINFDEIKFEKGEGLDRDLSDIFATNNKELFIISDGLIKKSVIHIVDISFWRDNWGYPKFHIYRCETIKEMQSKEKIHRYKASKGVNNEFYLVKKDKQWKETLELCSYCLNKYNSQCNTNKIKQDFSIKEWIEKPMSGSELPELELDIYTIPNRYTEEWSNISYKRKEQANYTCQACEKDFSNKECKGFLHTHHVDANKRNNTRENLRVLCIECHCKEHNHGHMKQSSNYKEWLRSKCFKIQSNK